MFLPCMRPKVERALAASSVLARFCVQSYTKFREQIPFPLRNFSNRHENRRALQLCWLLGAFVYFYLQR